MASKPVNTAGGNSAFKYFVAAIGALALVGAGVYFAISSQNEKETKEILESQQQQHQDIIEHRKTEETIEAGDYYGVLQSNNEVVIAAQKETLEEVDDLVVEIPAYVDGLMTTTVGEGLYADSKITAVIIPEGVERLEDNCFRNCKYLKSVTIPDSVKYIGAHAFDGCVSLTSFHMPLDACYLGAGCFANCTELTELDMPPYMEAIYEDTFRNTGLTTVKLDTVYEIGAHAFADCPNLTMITIRANTKKIDDTCFDGSDNIVICTTENSEAWKFGTEHNLTVIKAKTNK